jgi:hypothetical protein
MTRHVWAMSIMAAGLAIGVCMSNASAQQTTPPPVAKSTPAPAAKAAAPKKEVKKSTKTASACQGLEEKACGAKSECSWVHATKRKDGKEVKAYCRTKPKTSGKAPVKKTTAAEKAAPTATTPPAKK